MGQLTVFISVDESWVSVSGAMPKVLLQGESGVMSPALLHLLLAAAVVLVQLAVLNALNLHSIKQVRDCYHTLGPRPAVAAFVVTHIC